jgi:superfamily II DNA or RNA helicase
MKKIRPYQRECIKAIHKSLKKGIVNQLVVMATGTGKTFTAVQAIKGMGRVLWITHTEELIEQSAAALLAEAESDEIGLVKADKFDIDKPIVMASAQTLWRRLDKIPFDYFDVIVADECHLFGSRTFKLSLDHFQPKLRLGLTATPHRADGMLMGDIFDEIVFEYNIDRGIAEGYLCELDALRIKTNVSLDKVKTLGGEFNQSDLEEVINTPERNELIVEKYIQYSTGRQFIAFCVDVRHTTDLCSAFNARGIATSFVVGDKQLTTDRSGTIQAFKSEEYVGLTNCNVFTAGFDAPNVGCIIMASPTKSLTRYLQAIGRGTRLKNEKYTGVFGNNCNILDFIDSTTKHRLVNTWTLDKAKPPEQRTFTTQVKKLKLLEERERRIKASGLDRDVFVNLLALPVPKFSTSIRAQDPATQPQLDWVARLGFDTANTNYSKEMCNLIIANQPASANDAYWLQQRGYDISNGVTNAEYKMALREIKAREAKENAERLKKENKFPFTDIH